MVSEQTNMSLLHRNFATFVFLSADGQTKIGKRKVLKVVKVFSPFFIIIVSEFPSSNILATKDSQGRQHQDLWW